MTTVADLYLMQELDLEIEARQAALADVEERLGESEEVEEARREAEERRQRLREAQKKQREAEWKVEEVRAKIKPVEDKLYGGTIKNPKELVGLQQDMDSLRGRQRELEDRDLETMSAVEEGERALAEAERRLADLEAEWKAEQESLRQQRGAFQQELRGLEERRSVQQSTIESGLMRQYETLRAQHQGRAVAKVERGICQGCRITLPMHVLQRARRGNHLVHCTSCERILYLS